MSSDKITYSKRTIKEVVQHLTQMLDKAVILPNRELYFDILNVRERLSNSKQFLGGENNNE